MNENKETDYSMNIFRTNIVTQLNSIQSRINSMYQTINSIITNTDSNDEDTLFNLSTQLLEIESSLTEVSTDFTKLMKLVEIQDESLSEKEKDFYRFTKSNLSRPGWDIAHLSVIEDELDRYSDWC